MEQALRRELSGLVSWSTPKGGFFLWASFHEGVDTDRLLERAIGRGALYVPGSAFFVDAHSSADARLSFSTPSPERIDQGITRLAAAVRGEIAIRASEVPPVSEVPAV
jgi:DNA-binding transcriptional MocR family regulator